MIMKFTETMILPAVPDFIEDFDILYESLSWILSYIHGHRHSYDPNCSKISLGPLLKLFQQTFFSQLLQEQYKALASLFFLELLAL